MVDEAALAMAGERSYSHQPAAGAGPHHLASRTPSVAGLCAAAQADPGASDPPAQRLLSELPGGEWRPDTGDSISLRQQRREPPGSQVEVVYVWVTGWRRGFPGNRPVLILARDPQQPWRCSSLP
ncbi:MAG: hypothetical protein U5L11_06875 [Arhodomonas sp.]|nr:hypothetical protein [Arhodomonas sp.]